MQQTFSLSSYDETKARKMEFLGLLNSKQKIMALNNKEEGTFFSIKIKQEKRRKRKA